jgi:NOL1/NOP2/sun family putative RNA methylase
MLPEAFVSNLRSWLGSESLDFLDAMQKPAQKAVRLHRMTLREHGQKQHSEPPTDGVFAIAYDKLPAPEVFHGLKRDPVPWMEDAYYIPPELPLGRSVYHELGAYYIQEPSAMAVVAALSPRPGESILDLCAAPGGKTTAIGRALGGTGTLVANEIHPTRVLTLAQNLERTGVPAVVTNESPDRLSAQWQGRFDAVLVDAPCSGEGMFRKEPEAVSAWSPAAPEMCANRQRDILQHAVSLVRPGGRLVYSTCTFNPLENEQIVLWMLRNFPVRLMPLPDWPGWEPGHPEWAEDEPTLQFTRRLWPHHGRGEGHFVAKFEVFDEYTPYDLAQIRRNQPNDKQRLKEKSAVPSGWKAWLEDLLQMPAPQEWLRPVVHKNLIYTDETNDLSIAGLRVLRPGVCLATLERDRVQPHHHLAMSLWLKAPRHLHSLSEREARAYLAGEAVSAPERKGFYWLHLDGMPMGWGKSVPGRMNNLYPKGLRRTDLVLLG